MKRISYWFLLIFELSPTVITVVIDFFQWKKLTEEQKKQYEVRAEYIAAERAKQDAANLAAGKTVQVR